MTTAILHLTHGRNLIGIVAAGGLWSNNNKPQGTGPLQSIAYDRLQEQRARKSVPCGLGGTLHDYVPFYFGERSPMLLANKSGKVESNPDGQRPLIYLVSSAEAVAEAGLAFAFTDGHAVMGFTSFFDDLIDFANVDWDTVHTRDWADSTTDWDRKRKKQAEFLVHRFFPWELVSEIVVMDAGVQTRVHQILGSTPNQPPIIVRTTWYYEG